MDEVPKVCLRLTEAGSVKDEINENVDVPFGVNYYKALNRTLQKVQRNFNDVLTDVIKKTELENGMNSGGNLG